MFKLMWSMKKKGDKPHYKPGTDEKKQKYQKESLSVKDTKKLNKAAVLDQSKDPKDWESARARRTEIDYKDLVRQMKKKKMRNEATTMKDNNLFGNAYAGDYEKLKKKIGSKKKHDKPAIKEGISYKDFMSNVYSK